MEAYKVTATFDLNDLLGPRLAKLWKELDRLETKTVQVRRRLRDFGEESRGLRQASSAVNAMQRDMLKTEQNMMRMSGAFKAFNGANAAGGIKGIQGEFARAQASAAAFTAELAGVGVQVPELRAAASAVGRMDRNLAAATRNASALTAQLHGVAAAAGRIPNMPRGGGGSGGGGGGNHRGGGLHGGNVHVGKDGLGVGAIGFAAGPEVGAAALAAYASYEGIKSGVEASTDYNNMYMRFKALNLGDKANADADKFVKNSRHFGVNNTQMMDVLAESVGLFGSLSEAEKFAPRIAEIGAANAAVYSDGRGNIDQEGLLGLQKFIDRRGGFKDQASFEKNLDLAEQLITGSGGRITFADLDQFSQRGGTAFRGMSDEGIRRIAGLLIEQGGSTAGVGLMSLYQNLIADRTPKKTMAILQDMGIGQVGQVSHGMVGGKKITETVLQNIASEDLLRSNPAQWMTDVLLPKIHAYEDNQHLAHSDSQDLKFLNDVLSNRTGSNSASIMTTQDMQLIRDSNLNHGSMNSDQVIKMFADSPSGKWAEFESAWTNFKKTFGDEVLPAAIKIVDSGTTFLKMLNGTPDPSKDGGAAGAPVSHWWGKVTGPQSSSTPNPVATPANATTTVNVQLNVDGKKLADATVPHIVNGLGPRQSASMYDLSLGLPSFGQK